MASKRRRHEVGKIWTFLCKIRTVLTENYILLVGRVSTRAGAMSFDPGFMVNWIRIHSQSINKDMDPESVKTLNCIWGGGVAK